MVSTLAYLSVAALVILCARFYYLDYVMDEILARRRYPNIMEVDRVHIYTTYERSLSRNDLATFVFWIAGISIGIAAGVMGQGWFPLILVGVTTAVVLAIGLTLQKLAQRRIRGVR